MKIIDPSNLDVVFLSYEEPCADSFYEALNKQVDGRALRVHGVKGWDAAHKAAAAVSTTPYFVLVDGDALVYEEFWIQRIRVPVSLQNAGCYSFCARNMVNDLCYGYGGLKIWNKDFVLSMQTHEASDDPSTSIEFCWQDGYHHFASIWNETHINLGPMQAARAGFREVAKLLHPNCVYTPFENLPFEVQRKVVQWCTLGSDATNGIYCLLGANAAYLQATKNQGIEAEVVNSYERIDEMLHIDSKWSMQNLEDAFYDNPWEIFHPNASRQIKSYIRTQRWLNPPVAALTHCEIRTE